MRTILYTAYDTKYAPLAALTLPLMAIYAMRHGYGFDYYTGPTLPKLDSPDVIYWTKFINAPHLLENYDRIIWLDADQLITNPDYELDLPPVGFHVSKDWGFDAVEPWHFSVCGFVAHRDCIPMFKEVLELEPESRGKPFPEQQPMRDVIRACIERFPEEATSGKTMSETLKEGRKFCATHFCYRPPRFLNAVPNEVCPGKVVDPWQPGDFAAHLTMLDVPKRIELFHEIKKQAGI